MARQHYFPSNGGTSLNLRRLVEQVCGRVRIGGPSDTKKHAIKKSPASIRYHMNAEYLWR
jgi:hypothetical protein